MKCLETEETVHTKFVMKRKQNRYGKERESENTVRSLKISEEEIKSKPVNVRVKMLWKKL